MSEIIRLKDVDLIGHNGKNKQFFWVDAITPNKKNIDDCIVFGDEIDNIFINPFSVHIHLKSKGNKIICFHLESSIHEKSLEMSKN